MREFRNRWSARAVLFTIFLLCPCAYGRLQSLPNIAKLTEASSTIVVGEVLKVERLGATELSTADDPHSPGDTMAATVEVAEVLKGKVTHPVIEVDYARNPTWRAVRSPTLFLKTRRSCSCSRGAGLASSSSYQAWRSGPCCRGHLRRPSPRPFSGRFRTGRHAPSSRKRGG